jgi:hypothetical protein
MRDATQSINERILQDLTLYRYKKAEIVDDHIETEAEYIVHAGITDDLNLQDLPKTDKRLVLCILAADGGCMYYFIDNKRL